MSADVPADMARRDEPSTREICSHDSMWTVTLACERQRDTAIPCQPTHATEGAARCPHPPRSPAGLKITATRAAAPRRERAAAARARFDPRRDLRRRQREEGAEPAAGVRAREPPKLDPRAEPSGDSIPCRGSPPAVRLRRRVSDRGAALSHPSPRSGITDLG